MSTLEETAVVAEWGRGGVAIASTERKTEICVYVAGELRAKEKQKRGEFYKLNDPKLNDLLSTARLDRTGNGGKGRAATKKGIIIGSRGKEKKTTKNEGRGKGKEWLNASGGIVRI
jgi:hypothetical protein